MTKLYYDCPVKAGIMTKYQGVKVGIYIGDDLFTISNPWEHSLVSKYYIAPESMDIFEPREGDLVREVGGGIVFVEAITELGEPLKVDEDNEIGGGLNWLYVDSIIQRNNTPFIMPKEESDE